jgi:ABC-type spermidine/putrescine transport system permease subunit II
MKRRRRKPWFLRLAFAAVLAFLYLPLIDVILNGFNADASLVGWGGFTTEWYRTALNDSQVRSAFATSVKIAIQVAVISVVLAVTAALWARQKSGWWRAALDLTTYTRLVLPEVVSAIGIFILFIRYHIALGSTAIVLGHVVWNSAFATLVIQARLASMGNTLEEAAADLGANPWRTFRRVTVPQLMPAIVVSFLLVFSYSLDDVVTSLFLGGPNTQTLPVLLLGLVRHSVTPEVNAVGAIVLLITSATFLIAVTVSGLRLAVPNLALRNRAAG